MIKLDCNYFKIPKKKTKKFVIGVATYPFQSFTVIWPEKRVIKSWQDYPSHLPKLLYIKNAKSLFKFFPLPGNPDFLLVKDSCVIYNSKTFSICGVVNFLWFYSPENNKDMVEKLREVLSFFNALDVPIRFTFSSSAFILFHKYTMKDNKKSLFLYCPEILHHFNKEKLFKPLAFFKNGIYRNVYKYDVNSAYPFQLSQCMPGVPNYFGKISEKEILRYKKNNTVNIVDLKEPSIFENGNTNKVILSHKATLHQLDIKNIKKFHNSLICQGVNTQSDYISKMYRIRHSKCTFFKAMIKLCLNSVFGQFSKKIFDIKIREKDPSEKLPDTSTVFISKDETYRIERFLNLEIITRMQGQYHSTACPWIGISIFQNHLIDFTNDIPSSAFYADSDCFITPSRVNHVSISNELGDYKEEKVELLRVYGLKNYSQDSEHILAGVKESDEIIDSFQRLDIHGSRTINGVNQTIHQERSISCR